MRSLDSLATVEPGSAVEYADIRILGDAPNREVIATFPDRGGSQFARALVIEWARLTGHRRVWLEGEIADLTDALPAMAASRVTCPACGFEHRANGLEFWSYVHAVGHFPQLCSCCGASIPQWAGVDPDPVSSDSASDGGAR